MTCSALQSAKDWIPSSTTAAHSSQLLALPCCLADDALLRHGSKQILLQCTAVMHQTIVQHSSYFIDSPILFKGFPIETIVSYSPVLFWQPQTLAVLFRGCFDTEEPYRSEPPAMNPLHYEPSCQPCTS